MDEHRRRPLHHVIERIFGLLHLPVVPVFLRTQHSRGVHIERKGDTLVLRVTSTAGWFGALFGGFSIFWLQGWIRQESGGGLSYWGGVLTGVVFILFGLFLFLPREVNTSFDLRSRRVVRNVSFCGGLYEHRQAFSFDEIAGLGVKEYGGEGYSYMPVMLLRGGKTRRLATLNGGYLAWANTIDDVCSATGLPKLDFPTHWPL